MSLSGIRDLSIIETPPAERKSIDTVISRFDDEAIVNAVDRELARGGQVFFVHNIVANIDYMADYIRRICPGARIGVAHGQMPKRELEKVMEQFLDRRINCLVSSSIIGSGIDIGNANTIIINRADKFGMADLYQLRGRVGRSKVKGHAIMLIPETGRITKDARKRLSAIKEYESLGAGFQMAMRDMEIRGVGDILGQNQWGHVTAIGFELYQEMLSEAVALLQGKTVAAELDPEIKLGIDAYIPDEYCPEEHLRLGLYKKLATSSPEDIPGIMDELIDMYGPVPGPVRALLFIAETRGMMKRLRIRKLELSENFLRLYFSPDTVVNIQDLIDLVTEKQGRLTKEGMAGITIKDIREIHGILERLIQKTNAV
jgi:transcription-repair coupling factor (superfamily II helicase)